ncbi:hypothetical protein GGF50DRAFT_128775 [Schizophyllum commune]
MAHKIQELQDIIRGRVHLRGDPRFNDYATVFNGNVTTPSRAVALPLDAEDVSKIIRFCAHHGLSPSVKAGGYSTAGWGIGGDIVIDLCKIGECDIEPPHPDGSYTSIRDMAPTNCKGKGKMTVKPPPTPSEDTQVTGKRRRDHDRDDDHSLASTAVAGFLAGAPFEPGPDSRTPPTTRRRLDRQGNSSSLAVSPSDMSMHSPPSALPITSSPPTHGSSSINGNSSGRLSAARTTSDSSPFGYLDEPMTTSPLPPHVVQSNFNPHGRSFEGWDTHPNVNTVFANPALPPTPLAMLAQAVPAHDRAFVTFGAGLRQKEVDVYTAEHPLPARAMGGSGMGFGRIPYHVPFAAHPSGSAIMISAGFGFQGRLRGLSIDALVEAEVVLADGSIAVINKQSHPDLWWAIRGAGSAFGVVTRYKAVAYPIPLVYAGNLIYRFHRATAPSLIKHYRDCVKGAPRELYVNLLLTAGPADKDSLVVIQLCYLGPRERGQEFMLAISSWDGEKCLLNEVDEKSFLHQQDSVAQVLRAKAGRQWYIRSTVVTSLPDEVIHHTVLQFADTPVGCTWLFELAGGAIGDFDDTCVPKSQRETAFTLAALHQWEMDVDDDRCFDSAERWIYDTLRPVSTGGPFPSFLGRHEPIPRIKACYGANWDRLCELKRRYDPTNMFRHSFWPMNERWEEVESREKEPPTPKMPFQHL